MPPVRYALYILAAALQLAFLFAPSSARGAGGESFQDAPRAFLREAGFRSEAPAGAISGRRNTDPGPTFHAFGAGPVARPAGASDAADLATISVLIDSRPFASDFSLARSRDGFMAAIEGDRGRSRFEFAGECSVEGRVGRRELINRLPARDYIAGVIASETDSRARAFLEALAIAVRTMVHREIRFSGDGGARRRHGGAPYILCARTHCASYRGMPPKKTRAAVYAAVDSTAGMTLEADGVPAEIFYSSSCGGFRHTPQEIYGRDAGRENSSPPGNASKNGSAPPRLDDGVSGTGVPGVSGTGVPGVSGTASVGDFVVHQKIFNSPETCPCVKSLRKWTAFYPVEELSRALGTKVGELAVCPCPPAVIVNGALAMSPGEFMKKIEASRLPRVKSPDFTVKFDARRGGFVLSGTGLGHGIGMCLDGAARMAAGGSSALEILRFYYPDVLVVKAFSH